MDTYLAVTSKRDERRYADRRVPEDVTERILDAGRLAGSAANRQPWRFVVVESRDLVEQLADAVYEPQNVLGAGLVVAVVTTQRPGFDHGRLAQNMMLTAWNEGVVSCPNGIRDAVRAADVIGVGDEEQLAIVLSLGYPERPHNPESLSPAEWSTLGKRKPLSELVSRI